MYITAAVKPGLGLRWESEDPVGCRPGVSPGLVVGPAVSPPSEGAGHPATHRLRTQVPSGSLAPHHVACGPELPSRGAETRPGLHGPWAADLGPAHQSPGAPPPSGSGGEDPNSDVGGQHGGAGRHAGGIPRPRRQHAGGLQPAARQPPAWEDRRRVLQHAGGAGARPRQAQRGRREGGAGVDGAASTRREPPICLAPSPETKSEREAAGEDQEHLHPTHPQHVLTTGSYCERNTLTDGFYWSRKDSYYERNKLTDAFYWPQREPYCERNIPHTTSAS